MEKAGRDKLATEKSDAIHSTVEDYEIKDELKTTGAKVRTSLTDKYKTLTTDSDIYSTFVGNPEATGRLVNRFLNLGSSDNYRSRVTTYSNC